MVETKTATYQVVDTRTGQATSKVYTTRKAAMKAADKLDNQYGACRYRAQEVR